MRLSGACTVNFLIARMLLREKPVMAGSNPFMFEKRFYVEGLAHASYLLGAGGEAAIIDPKRDVDDYIHAAGQEKLKIVAILETHPHADFVSGHLELAQRTGA